jgi:UDP-N-acetylmuramoyl-tripeptide--D-alanyl-D-alanine ligase
MPADRVRIVTSHLEASELLRSLLRPGDRLLVKGSRGMQMEKVGAALRDSDHSLAAGNG